LFAYYILRNKDDLPNGVGCEVEALGRLVRTPAEGSSPLLAPVAQVECVYYQLQIVEEAVPEPFLVAKRRSWEDFIARWNPVTFVTNLVLASAYRYVGLDKEANCKPNVSAPDDIHKQRVLLDQVEGMDGASLDIDGELVKLSLAGDLKIPWTDRLSSVQVCTDPRVAGLMLDELMRKREPPVDTSRVFLRERYLEPSALVWVRGELLKSRSEKQASTGESDDADVKTHYELMGDRRHLHPSVRLA